MPDHLAKSGDIAAQKPEMRLAWRWADRPGVPVRGHEPAGPPILKEGLTPDRIAGLAQDMDALIPKLSPPRLFDIFCDRGPPETDAEHRLRTVLDALIDHDKALARTQAIIEAIRRLATPQGAILILCGGNHAPHLAAALPECRIIHGEYFY